MFADKFIDSLPDDPSLAADALCTEFFRFHTWAQNEAKEALGGSENKVAGVLAAINPNNEYHDKYVEALAAFQAYSEAKGLRYTFPPLTSDKTQNAKVIVEFFATVKKKLVAEVANLILEKSKRRYSVRFGGVFVYEFSQGDLDRVQELISALREEISKAKGLGEEHRQRLLKRLEQLQGELHKKLSDLDRFWGLVGDAGVVLGKLGEDAQPIVDRVKEITEIIWRTQSRSEELPTDAKPALLSGAGKNEVP